MVVVNKSTEIPEELDVWTLPCGHSEDSMFWSYSKEYKDRSCINVNGPFVEDGKKNWNYCACGINQCQVHCVTCGVLAVKRTSDEELELSFIDEPEEKPEPVIDEPRTPESKSWADEMEDQYPDTIMVTQMTRVAPTYVHRGLMCLLLDEVMECKCSPNETQFSYTLDDQTYLGYNQRVKHCPDSDMYYCEVCQNLATQDDFVRAGQKYYGQYPQHEAEEYTQQEFEESQVLDGQECFFDPNTGTYVSSDDVTEGVLYENEYGPSLQMKYQAEMMARADFLYHNGTY